MATSNAVRLHIIVAIIKLLASLTFVYFKNEDSIAERSMCIVAFLVYMILSMICLTLDEDVLETGLESAYSSFNSTATKYLIEQHGNAPGPASKIILKLLIAIFSGFLGSLFTFPGLRTAQMHLDSLKYHKHDKLMILFLNISFLMPFVIIVLWIKPICRDFLAVQPFQVMNKSFLTDHCFEVSRLLLMVFAVIIRIFLLPTYLQAYLNLAYDRIQIMRKEGGRITNVELKNKVSSVFSYLCVVALQVTAPLICCLCLTLLYKTLSGFNWIDKIIITVKENDGNQSFGGGITPAFLINDERTILKSFQEIQTSLTGIKKIFTPVVYKGFLGFGVWWSFFSLFISSAFGVLYRSHFTKL